MVLSALINAILTTSGSDHATYILLEVTNQQLLYYLKVPVKIKGKHIFLDIQIIRKTFGIFIIFQIFMTHPRAEWSYNLRG